MGHALWEIYKTRVDPCRHYTIVFDISRKVHKTTDKSPKYNFKVTWTTPSVMAATRVMCGSAVSKPFWAPLCLLLLVSYVVLEPNQRSNHTSRSSCEALRLKFLEEVLSFRLPSRHTRRRTFTLLRVPHNTGATSSSQLHLKSGDIHPNPGPKKRNTAKYPCGECQCNVRNNQDVILCVECQRWFHAMCINMSKATFKYYLKNFNLPWTCSFCSLPKFSDSVFENRMIVLVLR